MKIKSWLFSTVLMLVITVAILCIFSSANEGGSELSAPEYEISSREFVYDGEQKTVGFDSLTHRELERGSLALEWYREGELVSVSQSGVSVREVSDTGIYTCKITFTLDGVSVVTETEPFEIKINKAEVEIPVIEPSSYTGMPQLPRIYSTSLYTVMREPHTDAGKYDVSLTLTDFANYKWRGTDEPLVKVPFTINPATNFWVDEPSIMDFYAGERPRAVAKSAFGEAILLYSESIDGRYSTEAPVSAGKYYFMATVNGTDNYTAIKSAPVAFYVIEDVPTGIKIDTMPDRTSYLAFDKFSPQGMTARVTFASGRTEAVPYSRLSVEYLTDADCLRYGDSAVYITYLDAKIMLPVTVEKRSYDLSALDFLELTAIYNGEMQSGAVPKLPTGLDGIVLTATLLGGGIDVGRYDVTLSFATESKDYKLPSPVSVTLEILPLSVDVVWEKTEFVYDGTSKSPAAYFINERGERIRLNVSGEATNASDFNSAVAACESKNYTLKGDSVTYKIKKADYDMTGAFWRGLKAVYDGEEHRAEVVGLPTGVTVIEYVGGIGTDAGEYPVSCIFDYDKENYNPPVLVSSVLVIGKKVVPVPSHKELIYDGKEHKIALSASEYYQKEELCVRSIGKYCITLVLFDPTNFVFEGGSESVMLELTVRLSDRARLAVLLSAVLFVIVLILTFVMLLVRRERVRRIVSAIRCKATIGEEILLPPPNIANGPAALLSVAAERADELISDSLAKNLIVKEEEPIYTTGRRKNIINVDTLSSEFSDGDRVDINALKAKNLVPYDTAYLKVLARGVIDKPLRVYANDFSLAAVKMIALTGGEAIKVVTIRKKEDKKE
ncbi:MAG: uL15 family ribosomal protein [Clostridia bacterium]|nr:uL15 family ribosomal protein [Clostridia bacterium]